MQTIKSIALAPWDGRTQTASTWYEPLTDPPDIGLAVHWVLGREGVFLNTVGDVDSCRWCCRQPRSTRVSARPMSG